MLKVKVEKCEPGDEREFAWELFRREFGSVKVERTEYGKPFLSDFTDKYFSLSHSEGYAAIAVADAPVGVDVERLSRIRRIRGFERFAARVCAPGERCGSLFELLELWTRKEAYMKLDGRGLALGLGTFAVSDLRGVRFEQFYFDGDALCNAAVAVSAANSES